MNRKWTFAASRAPAGSCEVGFAGGTGAAQELLEGC
jgi:hypothetical protein